MKTNYITIALILFFTNVTFAQVIQKDFDALVAIYKTTNGDNWDRKDNWNTSGTKDDVTNDWYGITIENGRVTKLSLARNNLSGPLPLEIGNLTALIYLNLRWNSINHIPSEIGQCKSLNYISLGNNYFTEIPPEIGNLPVLRTLTFVEMDIVKIPKEIGYIKTLSRFEIYRTPITELPVELFNCTNLDTLVISMNNIKHIPPAINKLKKLTILDIGYNELTYLPNMSGLKRLKKLYATNNYLSFNDFENTGLDFQNISEIRIEHQYYEPEIISWFNKQNNKLSLKIDMNVQGNKYKWYKNNFEIPDSKTNTLIIPVNTNGVTNDVYFCEITNNRFPELIICTKPFLLQKNLENYLPENSNEANIIYISIDKPLYKNSYLELTDEKGKVIYKLKIKKLKNKNKQIYSGSNKAYTIKVKNGNEIVKTYKIVIE